MRLIDADALKDELAVLFERNSALIDKWLVYAVEDAIDDAPTIDPVKHVFSTAFDSETDMLVAERNGKKIEFVKVVRCQDCEMWGNSIILKDQSKGDCPNLGLMIDGDFFCKWGARKMDEVTE